MPKVVADITMSLDGFVTGPNPSPEAGLGEGGEALHEWAVDSDDPVDAEVLRTATESTAAVVMGRRLFDIVDSPFGWNEDMGYGARHAGSPPFFVVTHEAPAHVRLPLDFTFVTDGGVASAIDRARAAVDGERDGDVVVMGGGDVVRQCVEARLVDELRLHVAPVVLGGGTQLFGSRPCRLTQVSVRPSPAATHVVYRV